MDFLCFISQHLGTRAEKAIFWLLLETEISLSLVLNSCTGNLGSPAFWDTGLQRVLSRGRGKMCSMQWSQLLCVPMWQPRFTRAKLTPQSFQQQSLWDPALLLEGSLSGYPWGQSLQFSHKDHLLRKMKFNIVPLLTSLSHSIPSGTGINYAFIDSLKNFRGTWG